MQFNSHNGIREFTRVGQKSVSTEAQAVLAFRSYFRIALGEQILMTEQRCPLPQRQPIPRQSEVTLKGLPQPIPREDSWGGSHERYKPSPVGEIQLVENGLCRLRVLRRDDDCLARTNLDHAGEFQRGRRFFSLRNSRPGHRRELLRDNYIWRGQQQLLSLPGCGTVFKITPSGTLTTLYSFCAQADCADGVSPLRRAGASHRRELLRDNLRAAGLTALWHGLQNHPERHADHAVQLSLNDCLTAINPYAGLVQGTDGNFYGTTSEGGANGYGTVFKITPSGTLTTLHSFDVTDGAYPYAGLVQATDGNFYGTTSRGRGQRRWHGLQNHPRRHADHAVQLLLRRLH